MTQCILPKLASLVVLGLAVSSLHASENDRLQRAMDWPSVDITSYKRLYIEDVRVTDPKAAERKAKELVETVPDRMANLILFSVDPDLWEVVERGSPEPGDKGLVLRVDLTQYKPGSLGARATLIGTGSAHLNLRATLLDAASGQELAAFDENRTFAWGGFIGASRGITLMEENASKELAAWLALGKGEDPDALLEKMKFVTLQGPPEEAHGTIYILRPQGMVGAAQRFRIGIDDLTIGQTKRKRYHLVYAPPGEYEVWNGGDKKRWKTRNVTVEDGGVYYFDATNMKPMSEKKGAEKLKKCRLAREIDLTRI